jgi:cytochrome c oxidase subunit 3/cytochrome o ubiquinol oxidase subunit 3
MAVSHHDEFKAAKALGISHLKLGMWLFIASEVMFFGGLIAAFLNFKLNVPTDEIQLLDVALVGVNTFILLTSSFTVVLGLDALRQDKPQRLAFFLGMTILLGVVFLGGQAYEFSQLAQQGVTLSSSVFGSSFYTLTSFHGMHVLIGVLWALRNLLGTLRGKYGAESVEGIELFGLYWHFVDIVWIVLFTLIYLI